MSGKNRVSRGIAHRFGKSLIARGKNENCLFVGEFLEEHGSSAAHKSGNFFRVQAVVAARSAAACVKVGSWALFHRFHSAK
jgi:hypothetical protein